ncbi:MAG: TetR/AcrR family transcriptional regulator [Ruminococcus sp.]|nr:TetR/AcrR family transcriptional regulator [Ruminococcus sp.]MBQ1921046.1 TetR/AcrR family transcriptional regulator [Ruminococcus sp.]
MTNETKDAIKTTFMELLNRKPLNKITVREIVSGCDINRNTFYYHYTDIRTLVEEIFDEQSSYILRTVEGKSVYECLTTAISFALENKSAMLHIYNSPDREVLEQYIFRSTEQTISRYIRIVTLPHHLHPEDEEAIVLYYKSLLTGLAVDWLSGGMKYDLSDKLKRVCELFDGTLESVIIKCRIM